MPTSFDDKIQFASLDVPTELCLHCACSKGIELMLEKSAEPGASNLVRQDVDLLNLVHEHQIGGVNGTLVAWSPFRFTTSFRHLQCRQYLRCSQLLVRTG